MNKNDFISWRTHNNKKLWGLVMHFDTLFSRLAVGEYYPVTCNCSKNKIFEINILLSLKPDDRIKDKCIIRDQNNVIALNSEDIDDLANCLEINSVDKGDGEIFLNRNIKIRKNIITVVYRLLNDCKFRTY